MDQWFKNSYSYIRHIITKNRTSVVALCALLTLTTGLVVVSADGGNTLQSSVSSTTVESTTTTTVPVTSTTAEVEVQTPATTTTSAPLPHEIYTKIGGQSLDFFSCEQWFDTAIQVGFEPEQWPTLSFIIFRESRCDPTAWNRKDPTSDGSRGLTQINGVWCEPNQYNPTGWLQAKGILKQCSDLHNPVISLRATLALWKNSGWQPWGL